MKRNLTSEGGREELVAVQVHDVEPGFMLDLAGDPYADPFGDSRWMASDYAVVEAVEPETGTWGGQGVVLFFEDAGAPVRFPPGHEVRAVRDVQALTQEQFDADTFD